MRCSYCARITYRYCSFISILLTTVLFPFFILCVSHSFLGCLYSLCYYLILSFPDRTSLSLYTLGTSMTLCSPCHYTLLNYYNIVLHYIIVCKLEVVNPPTPLFSSNGTEYINIKKIISEIRINL